MFDDEEYEMYDSADDKDQLLAWEHYSTDSERTLWRVSSIWILDSVKTKSIHWFTSKENADKHVERIKEKGHTIISVDQYNKCYKIGVDPAHE